MIGGPETTLAAAVPPPLPVDPAMDPMTDQQVGTEWEMTDPYAGLPPIMPNDGMGIPIDAVRMNVAPERMDVRMPAGAPLNYDPRTTPPPGVPDPLAQPAPDPFADPRGYREGPDRVPRVSVSAPRFNQRNLPTQRDFYGETHPISWTDARGVQMHVPEAGQLPMAIAAGRIAQSQAEIADIQKAKRDLLKSQQVEPTADPYDPSFRNMLGDLQASFVSGLAEQFDGNEYLAWKEILNDPATAQEWEALHQEAEALGRYGKFIWGEAKGYLDRAATGKYAVDPETRKYAEEVYGGFGNMKGKDGLPNMRALLNSADKFHRAISREEFTKQFILPSIKDRYKRWAEAKVRREGGMNIVETTSKYNAESFLKEMAESMVPAIPGSTVEENLRYLRNVIPPEQMELDISARNVPSGKSGSGKKDAASLATVDYTVMPRALFDMGGTRTPGAGTDLEYPTLNLVDEVSDQGRTPMARELRARDGTIFMHPTRVMNINGKLFVVGKKTGQQRTAAEKRDGQGGIRSVDSEGTGELDIQEFNKLPDVVVPYDGNEGLIASMFPGITEERIKRDLGWAEGKVSARKRKEVAPFATDGAPEITSQQQYDALPVGAKYMSGGKEYTKK